MLKTEELDEKYETIKKNRINFVKESFDNLSKKFLSKWKVSSYYSIDSWDGYYGLRNNFIDYICRKEDFKGESITETKIEIYRKGIFRRKKEKEITTTKEKKHIINERLLKIQDIDKIGAYEGVSYKRTYIENLTYEQWQEFKELISYIKKYLSKYIIKLQKKKICNLTDCFKEGTFNRICELCGNDVDEDAIYCTQCGEAIK